MKTGGIEMDIQGYQINNVLNVYRRQLSQSRTRLLPRTPGAIEYNDRFQSSSAHRRKALIDNVFTNIANTIKKFGLSENVADSPKNRTVNGLQPHETPQEVGRHQFLYNYIDHENRKVGGSIGVNDSEGLVEKIEQFAQRAIDRKTGTR
jgi:hypothetical protein